MADDEKVNRSRWRLILGNSGNDQNGDLSEREKRMDQALEYLYGREYRRRNVRQGGQNVRGGSLDPSSLTVPAWINSVHELFPKATVERIEKDAMERYELNEVVTNPECLARATPSVGLLKAILQTKHLMNKDMLTMARGVMAKVIQQLMEKLARPVSTPFTGAVNRNRRSYLRVAKNFDAARTIRLNLKHYDSTRKKLLIQEPVFYSRLRRRIDQWQLIILVDQSGSMMGSVIYSAVCASIFWGLQALRTHLIVFDTSVVDLTDQCQDALETLMKVQLCGGTDIANAVSYAASLVEQPRRTIIVLITDLFEGREENTLIQQVKQLYESGVHMLVLAALDETDRPAFNHMIGQALANMGAHVGAMTPGELARWVCEKVNG